MENEIYCLKLTRMEQVTIFIKPVANEIKLFSSMEKAEEWLLDNDFFMGQRDFLNYPNNDMDWCHKMDRYDRYVKVEITTMCINDCSPMTL